MGLFACYYTRKHPRLGRRYFKPTSSPTLVLLCLTTSSVVLEDGYAFTISPQSSSSLHDRRKQQGACNNRRFSAQSPTASTDSSSVHERMALHNNNNNNDAGESFAHRMSNQQEEQRTSSSELSASDDEDSYPLDHHHGEEIPSSSVGHFLEEEEFVDDDESNFESYQDDSLSERRKFLHALLSSTKSSASAAAVVFVSSSSPASAFERSYPPSLDFDDTDGDTTNNLQSLRKERIAAKKARTRKNMSDLTTEPLTLRSVSDVVASVVWAGALWLISGSRSNPLVMPLANILYSGDGDGKEEKQWMQDRKEGLFSPLPVGFSLLLGLVFLGLGVLTDRALLFLSEGDSSVVLQLAGVSLIGGGALELGRIANGEKLDSRSDSERDAMLQIEFDTFAEKRLVIGVPGSSCHRSDVCKAFRRFFAKYRVDNEDYPLSDLEIERLFKSWNKRRTGGSRNGGEDVSSAGFLKGVQINTQADVFVDR